MALIEVRDVVKSYAEADAVAGISLDVEEGETLVLIGTSGSGKTTLLKMINRLIEPTSGEIRIRGENILEVDPIALRRDIGYVIQRIGLFPHMTVGENVSVVPRLKGWPLHRRREQTRLLLGTVGLEPDQFMGRYPGELSGGQQQRVGVARALAGDPPIILMDEPFGALDPITREQLQGEFRQLKERIRKTIVFVTHDIFEAVAIADRMAIIDAGKLLQIDTPERVLTGPADEFVARFLGKHRLQLEMTTLHVREVMDEDPPTIPASADGPELGRLQQRLQGRRAPVAVVVGGNRNLEGLVTADALRQAVAGEAALAELADRSAPAVTPGTDLLSAMQSIAESNYSALPVQDDEGRAIGLVTASSLIEVLSKGLTRNSSVTGEEAGR